MKRILVGDVLALALDQDHHCVAQVIGTYGRGSYFIAVYDRPPVLGPASAADLAAVEDAEMALLALTLDAPIHHGAWVVVGRSGVSSRAWLPGYLLDRASPPESVRQIVVDHSGKRERPASDRDLVRVKYSDDRRAHPAGQGREGVLRANAVGRELRQPPARDLHPRERAVLMTFVDRSGPEPGRCTHTAQSSSPAHGTTSAG